MPTGQIVLQKMNSRSLKDKREQSADCLFTFLLFVYIRLALLRHDERMEAEAEGDDENDEDDGELEEGLEDVEEHDDVDAEEGQLPDVTKEVEPGQDHRDGSHLPLPTL